MLDKRHDMTTPVLDEHAKLRVNELNLSLPVVVGSPFPSHVSHVEYEEDPDFPHSIHRECKFAIDYGVPLGSPVTAVRGGTVIMVKDDSREFGVTMDHAPMANLVCIAHPDGIYSEYIHLGYQSVFVKVGDRVEAGQVIGRTGESGLMTNEHLHLNVFILDGDQPVGVPFKVVG